MAWFLAAVAGVPVLLVTAWGLAGGYSFRFLPFLLVPYALPLVVAPLIAGFVPRAWPGRGSDSAALGIALLCAAASSIAVLAIGFTLPFSLLDDSGHATDNFGSLVDAELVTLTYLVSAIVTVVALAARVKAPPRNGRTNRARLIWKSSAVAGGCALLLLVSGVAGLANGSRLDGAGIPIEPGAAWMASRPESTMGYSGVAVSSAFVKGEEKQLSHPGDAAGGVTFYTVDPVSAVQGSYAERLRATGWRPVGISRSSEDGVWAFKRGDRELFVLRYYKPSGAFADPQHPGEGRYQTTYSVFPIGEPHI